MRMLKINIALIASLWLAASGCVADEQAPAATTSAVRGVATYDVESSATLTSVIGRDPQGNEVMRLDLTHGLFPVTDDIRENFKHDTEIVGRRFDVYLEGRDVWFWAVRGLEVGWMHLPGPNGDPRVRAFLQEPHVKAVFDQWHLGFDMPVIANGQEDEYSGIFSASGTSGVTCNGGSPAGSDCGVPRTGGPTAYSCGGNASSKVAVTQGWRVTQTNLTATNNGHTATGVNQWLVAQFCPSTSPPSAPKGWVWVATKSCPINPTVAGTGLAGNGCPTAAENGGVATYVSTCGCADQGASGDACVSCPGGANKADYYGSVTGTSTSVTYGYYALGDTVGHYDYYTAGGLQHFYFPGGPTSWSVSGVLNDFNITSYVRLTWSNATTGCSGSNGTDGLTGICQLGFGNPTSGSIKATSTSGHTTTFNASM